MVKMTFFLLGKAKEPFIKDGYEEYAKRLSKYGQVSFKFQEEITPKTEADGVKCLDEEGKKALVQIKDSDFVVLADLHGKMMDSISFAEILKKKIDQGASSLVFLVGSSNGLSDLLRKRANLSVCLSEMTTTHPLALLLLMEQVYRTFKINAGETYHK